VQFLAVMTFIDSNDKRFWAVRGGLLIMLYCAALWCYKDISAAQSGSRMRPWLTWACIVICICHPHSRLILCALVLLLADANLGGVYLADCLLIPQSLYEALQRRRLR